MSYHVTCQTTKTGSTVYVAVKTSCVVVAAAVVGVQDVFDTIAIHH